MGSSNSGRKSDYSEELAKRICETMADGKTLSAVCRMQWAPARATVSAWAAANPTFKAAIRQARIDGAWALYDELFEIADEMPKDNAQASRQREKIKVAMWCLSKIVPHDFGDKVSVDMNIKGDARQAEALADATILADARLERGMRLQTLREIASQLGPGAARQQFLAQYPEAAPYVSPILIEGTALRLREPVLAESEDDVFNER